MTVRGGGVPRLAMASMPPLRMGPPPRSFAADAHACIMVRAQAHRIQGCGSDSCLDCELHSTRRQSTADKRIVWSILRPDRSILPPSSEPSRCGVETAESVARSEQRPTLTAPARAGGGGLRSGWKKAFGEVEQKKYSTERRKKKV